MGMPCLCRAGAIEEVVRALHAGIDDLIIDPVCWPRRGGISEDEIATLVHESQKLKRPPRTIVYSRDVGSQAHTIQRLMAWVPAIWRRAPDELALPCVAAKARSVHDASDDRATLLRTIESVIEESLRNPAHSSPKQIAARVGRSEKTVNRYLRSLGKPSLAALVREARCAYASELSRTHGGNAHALAQMCGWTDARALRRALRSVDASSGSAESGQTSAVRL